mmetsp:Transcript_94377/g.158431  ORF Transcript_94377/g.158431 Transcript_94377/m.158431 type:complete len:100 (-) Transcript_94377:635-934(-)
MQIRLYLGQDFLHFNTEGPGRQRSPGTVREPLILPPDLSSLMKLHENKRKKAAKYLGFTCLPSLEADICVSWIGCRTLTIPLPCVLAHKRHPTPACQSV